MPIKIEMKEVNEELLHLNEYFYNPTEDIVMERVIALTRGGLTGGSDRRMQYPTGTNQSVMAG